MDRTALFYSQPSYLMKGNGFPIFVGSRRQSGGGSFLQTILPTLKEVGKKALQHATNFAKDVGTDIIDGGDVTESLKRRGLQHGNKFVKRSVSAFSKIAPTSSRKRRARTKLRRRSFVKRRRRLF